MKKKERKNERNNETEAKDKAIKAKRKQHLRSVASNHVNLLHNHRLKRNFSNVQLQIRANFFPFVYACQREKHNTIDEGFI